MASVEAYLDDYGKVLVHVSRRYYNGLSDGFYMTCEDGEYLPCAVVGVEEHERHVRYMLSIPNGFQFGKRWMIHESHGYIAPLQIRFITQTEKFAKQFFYDGEDLGASYQKDKTTFKVFAPTSYGVILKLQLHEQVEFYAMKRQENGVFEVSVNKDCEKALYSYLVERDGVVVEAIDPYGLSTNANNQLSCVVNTEMLNTIPFVTPKTSFQDPVDAIIYECNVRDLTSRSSSCTKQHGTFSAFVEEGSNYDSYPTGFDYIQSLGVTHLQLQPVIDYVTVDENYPHKSYNWGYDPATFLSLEGSYSSNPNDPYARMIEFKNLVCKCHEKDLRVNLDLVLNHVYDTELNCVNRILPYYYFRYNERGYASNGSYCGNDFDSKKPMCRHLLKSILKTMIDLYDVDGFRFDLMGILDVETMNQLHEFARSKKENIMFYGEGWNLPTSLDEHEKAMILNQEKMPLIGHFNDVFRDVLKGRTSDDQLYDQGYLTGKIAMSFDACSCYCGHVLKEPYFYRFDAPQKSINAIETHDNATLWDKMHFACMNEPREIRKKRQKMCIASILFAQGVPFLHAGMEFCGTKNDHTNSYNAKDGINGMDYQRMIHNLDVVEYTKSCIALRKKHEEFRLRNCEQIMKEVHFGIDEANVLFYSINHNGHDTCVIINPNDYDRFYPFEEGVHVLFDADGHAVEDLVTSVTSKAYSIVVIQK